MQNSHGDNLHKCPECNGRGKWLICSKMSKRKPTKKDPREEFLDSRKYSTISLRSMLETYGFECQIQKCVMCQGAGLISAPSIRKQLEMNLHG